MPRKLLILYVILFGWAIACSGQIKYIVDQKENNTNFRNKANKLHSTKRTGSDNGLAYCEGTSMVSKRGAIFEIIKQNLDLDNIESIAVVAYVGPKGKIQELEFIVYPNAKFSLDKLGKVESSITENIVHSFTSKYCEEVNYTAVIYNYFPNRL